MTYNIKRIFRVIFVLLIGVVFIWTSSTRPSILVIHSQDAQHLSTKNINKGVRSVFKGHSFYHTYYHYMELDHTDSKSEIQEAIRKALDVVDSLNPKYIILVGDRTQEFVGKRYINHPHINIIYCDVKKNAEAFGYHKATNVTGIQTVLPLRALNDLLVYNIAQGSFDSKVRLIPLSDTSVDSQEDDQMLKEYSRWEKVELRPFIEVQTFKAWKAKVLSIEGPRDIILLSHYQSLVADKGLKKFVPPKEIIQWTIENSKVPVVALYGDFVLDGGHLAITSSPIEQGERAAKIVENLIEHDIYIEDIKSQRSKFFLVYLRDIPKHKPYKLIVPDVYKAFALAMHHYFE